MALPSALSARASSLGRGPTRTYASGSVQICTRARAPLPLWLAAWTVDAARVVRGRRQAVSIALLLDLCSSNTS